MTKCSDYIKSEFPLIDDDLKQYVEGIVYYMVLHRIIMYYSSNKNDCFSVDVLTNGADDFESSEEVYEAVGEVLQEISCDKSEAEIRLESFHVYIHFHKLISIVEIFVRSC